MPAGEQYHVYEGPIQETPIPGHRPVHVLEGPLLGTDFEAIPGMQSCCMIAFSEPYFHQIDPSRRQIDREDVAWFWCNMLCSGQFHGQWIIPPTGSDWRSIVRFETFDFFIRNNSAHEIRYVDPGIWISFRRKTLPMSY